jgi:outer membrane protein OmpA-like peptidoglycan-associated protein
MTRHRSLALGFGACLALGVIDLVALNVWLAPAAWPPSVEGSRGPPARSGATRDTAPHGGAAATAVSPDAATARAALDAAPGGPEDAAIAATRPDARLPAPRRSVAPPAVFRTRRLFFATASSELSARAVTKLRRVVDALKRYPALKVQLDGHTDQRGREGFNDQLSVQRAEVVSAYLQQQGISRVRISIKGHSATRPLATDDTPKAWQRNRRVEIRIRKGTDKP